uniref:EOG090X02D0 n=1 Tax=Scapholeberis mucronata TaxID=202097 RepID=A0A4Y7NJZ9_9CRUS|nr:EOG090X02D0 [Scapholeberis mucronata]SVE93492.1 EOG090X02D0 [Scapholeberis mucronata]
MANILRTRSRKRAKGEICHLVSTTSQTDLTSSAKSSVEQPLNLCVRDETIPVPLLMNAPTAEKQVLRNPTIRRRKKRSAIFLPPEKLADNDVCICKFKFVAGHTPKLQEKKILSLDSGGNFRFFPELQPQPENHQQEKKKAASLPQQPVQQHFLPKPIPDLLPIEAAHPTWSVNPTKHRPKPSETTSQLICSPVSGSNRKLSRRQKIEQTFGDKGFLIQTQHVPATEGSAFCKFRQLKKFTRYLYRSWRHYLPDESQSINTVNDEG